ncbi:unnamed protein product [Peronospora belbahrii]|uniref:Uncharacterized protein n=1 Tax=Peronospora belbahrii TaxID=622444 RepID=A0ABN8DB81_9STRA|nr:unnamed protein product [Peronospora belbahrii]
MLFKNFQLHLPGSPLFKRPEIHMWKAFVLSLDTTNPYEIMLSTLVEIYDDMPVAKMPAEVDNCDELELAMNLLNKKIKQWTANDSIWRDLETICAEDENMCDGVYDRMNKFRERHTG